MRKPEKKPTARPISQETKGETPTPHENTGSLNSASLAAQQSMNGKSEVNARKSSKAVSSPKQNIAAKEVGSHASNNAKDFVKLDEKKLSDTVLNWLLKSDYLYLNPDVRMANADPVEHFRLYGKTEQRSISVLFNGEYLTSLARAKQLDLEKYHYSQIFFDLGNKDTLPNEWMNLEYIKNSNPDFKNATPVEIIDGILKQSITNIHPLFDHEFYVAQAMMHGMTLEGPSICHYLKFGWQQGLDPHPLFDSWFFHESNRLQAQTPPLIQYLDSSNYLDLSIGPFVDEKHLNHRLTLENESRPKELNGLTFALQSKDISADALHPHLTYTMISYITCNGNIPPYDLEAKSSPGEFAELIKSIRIPKDRSEAEGKTPEISVIIVNYRKPVLTILSVISVLRSLEPYSFEVIVVDNDGEPFFTELFYRYFSHYSNIRVIATARNLYFGEGNNIAIDQARGKYVWFLNNDAFIDSKSASNLIEIIRSDESIGAVGPTMFDAALRIGEVGGVVSPFSDVLQQGKGRPLDKAFDRVLNAMGLTEVDYVSAACLLVRNDLLKKFGGFDYTFEPFYYEDTDLCLRLKKEKFRIAVLANAYCLHLENTSTREFLSDKFNSVISASRAKFFSRWAPGNEHEARTLDCSLIGRPTEARRSAAIYTPFHITLGGGENYILSLAAAASKELNVTVITDNQTSVTRFAFVLRDLGIDTFSFAIATRDAVQGKTFDLAIVMGNEIVPSWVPSARKFIYHCQFPFPISHSARHLFDKNGGIDIYLVNSEFTHEALKKQIERYKLPAQPIEILNPPVNTSKLGLNELALIKLSDVRTPVCFTTVGRFFSAGHCKRQDVVARVLRKVSLSTPLVGYIYGGLSTNHLDHEFYNSVAANRAEGAVTVVANVSRSVIENSFEHAHYYVHAAGLGVNAGINPQQCEHFGITVVEAMAHGCVPIVYSIGGPAEIVRKAGIGYLFSTEDELSLIIEKLAEEGVRSESYLSMMVRAHTFAQEFSRSNFYNRAQTMINNIINYKPEDVH